MGKSIWLKKHNDDRLRDIMELHGYLKYNDAIEHLFDDYETRKHEST